MATPTMTADVNVIAPREFYVPIETPAATRENAMSGALIMSGAKLYLSVGNGIWHEISSAAP